MKAWKTNYNGHEIRVENRVCSERLLVDGELQDEQIGWAMRSRLSGKVRNGEAGDTPIKVSLGGWFLIQCRIFVDDKLLFSSS